MLRKNYSSVRGLVLRKYPRFVFGGSLDETESFERKLAYLKDDGYRSLDADEWLDAGSNPAGDDGKRILLTFDDGHISLWSTAYPLLKKYSFKAVSFIIRGLIPEGEEAAVGGEARALCNWQEIRLMHDSGYVDFQSHSLRHDLIFVSAHLEGWLSPAFQPHHFGKHDKAMVLADGDDFSVTNLSAYPA